MPQETILVVEDEAVTALDIQQSLRRKGYEVPRIATSGEEAIAMVRLQQPNLVLIDIRLPGNIDGIQAAQCIRQEYNIPIVFLTAFADSATLQRAKSAEPCAYLLKPFEDTLLATTIEIAIHKNRAHEALVHDAAEALQLSENRFHQLADNVADHAVQLLDASGRIMSWNKGSEQMHGWDASEVLGKPCSVLYPEEEILLGRPAEDIETAARVGRQHEYCRQLCKNQQRFSAEVILLAVRNQEGVPAGFLRVTRAVSPGGNHN